MGFKLSKNNKEDKPVSRLEYLSDLILNSGSLTDEEDIEYHNLRLAELPEDIISLCIKELNEVLQGGVKEDIQKQYGENPVSWASPYHFFFGMSIRNLFRDKVCKDDKLPSPWGWDDYYTQILEIWAGVREWKTGIQ